MSDWLQDTWPFLETHTPLDDDDIDGNIAEHEDDGNGHCTICTFHFTGQPTPARFPCIPWMLASDLKAARDILREIDELGKTRGYSMAERAAPLTIPAELWRRLDRLMIRRQEGMYQRLESWECPRCEYDQTTYPWESCYLCDCDPAEWLEEDDDPAAVERLRMQARERMNVERGAQPYLPIPA